MSQSACRSPDRRKCPCNVPKLSRGPVAWRFSTVRDSSVLVDHAAEDSVSADRRLERDNGRRVVVGRPVVAAQVWPVIVEVPGVLIEDCRGVVFVVDQDSVGALGPDAADEPLGVAVGCFRPTENALAKDGLWSHAGDPLLVPARDATPLAVLPETLQRLFRAAFVDRARNPEHRPSASEWLAALVRLRASLVACARAPDHVYSRDVSSCPWCPLDARSPSRTEGSVPAGYLRPDRSSQPPAGAAEALTEPAPTLQAAGHDIAATGAGSLPPTLPSQCRLARTPPRESASSASRRSVLRVAAWAAAVVGIGGVIGLRA
jgi:hypothetical protein